MDRGQAGTRRIEAHAGAHRAVRASRPLRLPNAGAVFRHTATHGAFIMCRPSASTQRRERDAAAPHPPAMSAVCEMTTCTRQLGLRPRQPRRPSPPPMGEPIWDNGRRGG